MNNLVSDLLANSMNQCLQWMFRLVKRGVLVSVIVTVVVIALLKLSEKKRSSIPLLERNLDPEDEASLPPLRRRYPQAFMLGAGKCGTGALRKFMGFHPNIVVPQTEELWFYYTSYEKGEQWHLKQMPLSTPRQVTIECSPAYFHEQIAMVRISSQYPNALFVVILRDPVDRAISQFLHDMRQRRGWEHTYVNPAQLAVKFETQVLDAKGKLQESWLDVKYGVYSTVLKDWLKLVPKSRIHVVDGSNLIVNPYKEMKMLEEFLELPSYYKEDMFVWSEEKGFYCYKNVTKRSSLKCTKKDKGNKHPPVKESVLNTMAKYFEPYNEELYRLIGRRFNWRKGE